VGDHSRRRRRCEAAVIDALISRFQPYYQLADYLAAYNDWMVGLAVGQPSVKEIADGQYYTDLPGGVLESMGRLFKRSVRCTYTPPEGSAPRAGAEAPYGAGARESDGGDCGHQRLGIA